MRTGDTVACETKREVFYYVEVTGIDNARWWYEKTTLPWARAQFLHDYTGSRAHYKIYEALEGITPSLVLEGSTSEEIKSAEEMEVRLGAERGIRPTGRHTYAVRSTDGQREYTVTWVGRTDDMVVPRSLWKCDCPAGIYGRNCKHWRAVAALVNEVNDEFGYE